MERSAINSLLKHEIEKGNTPSIQYLFFDDNKIFHSFQHGYSSVIDGKEVGKNTMFHAFSVTKTFTSLAILKLCEQNILSLDASAKIYLPTFPYSEAITIRQLLNHTSGIPNPIPLSWIHLVSEHDSFNRDKYFDEVFRKHPNLNSKPGEKFSYSNLGYILLGKVIETVTGKQYENYIAETIIKDIGVYDGELGFKIKEFVNHATGYHKKWSFSNLILGFMIDKPKFMFRSEDKWMAFEKYYVNGAPYGGLIGTPNAFAIYLQSLLKNDSTLISENVRTKMFTENILPNGKCSGMCLGWYTGKLGNLRYVTHAGGGGGYYCELRIYPDIGYGSVVMFNRTGMTDERYLDKPDTIALNLFGK